MYHHQRLILQRAQAKRKDKARLKAKAKLQKAESQHLTAVRKVQVGSNLAEIQLRLGAQLILPSRLGIQAFHTEVLEALAELGVLEVRLLPGKETPKPRKVTAPIKPQPHPLSIRFESLIAELRSMPVDLVSEGLAHLESQLQRKNAGTATTPVSKKPQDDSMTLAKCAASPKPSKGRSKTGRSSRIANPLRPS